MVTCGFVTSTHSRFSPRESDSVGRGETEKSLFYRYPHEFRVEDQGSTMIKKRLIEISKVPSTTNFIVSRIFQNQFQLVVFIIAYYFVEILFNGAY